MTLYLSLVLWLGLLVVLGAMTLFRRAPRPVEWVFQTGVAAGVVLLSASSLLATAHHRGAGVEVTRYRFPVGEAPLTLGTDPSNDVVLLDGYAAPVHVALRGVETLGVRGLAARSLTRERRLERNGIDIHHSAVFPGDTLILDGQKLRIDAVRGFFPSITVTGPDGKEVIAPSLARRVAASVPVLGMRVEAAAARLEPGFGARPLSRDLVRGDRPVAELALRGGLALVRFPTAADRDAHPLLLLRQGETVARRPADREALLKDGDSLTLGYSKYQLDLSEPGFATLMLTRGGSRFAFPRDGEGLLLLGGRGVPGSFPFATTDPLPLLFQPSKEGGIRLGSPGAGYGFSSENGILRFHKGGGNPTASLEPGASGLLRVEGETEAVTFRLRGEERPLALIRGADPSDPGTLRWRVLLALAVTYLLSTLFLVFRGVLTLRGGAFFHGLMLAFGQGLAGLSQLSVPGDPRLGGFVDKQAQVGLLGMVGMTVALWWVSRPYYRYEARVHVFQWLERPLLPGGKRQGLFAQPRVWMLWALSCLLLMAQLPFGEEGVALPGLGSVQPVELTKTCLLLFLAWFTVRALEDKAVRVRGPEGTFDRWRYLAHAVPLLVIVFECFGLDDISPILIFGSFLLCMYWFSVRWTRVTWTFWVELLALFVGLVSVLLLAPHAGGTVSRRFLVWMDPFRHTSDAGQFVTSLWTFTGAGLWGAGWGGTNGALPPAVQDDFALAMLVAHTGLLGLVLLVLTYGVALLGGMAAAFTVHEERPDLPHDGTRERVQLLAVGALLLLAIQLLVVLGSVTGWMPVMGQPLPFVAGGGSHLLLFCFPAIAFVLAATRRGQTRKAP